MYGGYYGGYPNPDWIGDNPTVTMYMAIPRLTLLAIGCDYCWMTVQYYIGGLVNHSYSVE